MVDPAMAAGRVIESIAAIVANDDCVCAIVKVAANPVSRVIIAAIIVVDHARARAIGRNVIVVVRYDASAIVITAIIIAAIVVVAIIPAPVAAMVASVVTVSTMMPVATVAMTIPAIIMASVIMAALIAVAALVCHSDGGQGCKREGSCSTYTEKERLECHEEPPLARLLTGRAGFLRLFNTSVNPL
jgi:hypothetical protein|tara:strand:+ start:36091 stop:36651 length:561 start_codon:yes stop_codon:yes gene_type:complete